VRRVTLGPQWPMPWWGRAVLSVDHVDPRAAIRASRLKIKYTDNGVGGDG
jgi:hypothetical protein